jgi:RNA polymerase II subunit A-like phosphatase
MSSPTSLHLPPNLPFPIKIASLDIHPPSPVTRGTRLLTYSFVYIPASRESSPETRFGTWDSSVEGTIQAWKFKVGDVVSEKRARERPAAEVIEPCKHGVQIGGLCGLCGKDMTE